MKTSFILIVAFAGLFTACSKNNIQPSDSVSASSQEDVSIIKTRSSLLAAHPWMYQEYDFNYIDEHHRGDPQYIRGASNNTEDLDNVRFTFKSDGTFLEKGDNYRQPGKWYFSDRTATLLILEYRYYTNRDSILVLNQDHLKYTEPLGYHEKTYTELITAE